MAKSIRLSSDDVTYNTLPGNTGELANESGQLPDTIFGQDFESNFPGLIGWTINANGIFKGFAGYEVGLNISGTSTSMTDETTSQVGATQTYAIDDATKNMWDRETALVVEDNGTPVAASNIESINYLFGRVTFVSGYSVTGAITVSGAYLPRALVAGSRSFTLTQTASPIDETTIPDAQANDGHRIFDYGLKTVSIDISGVYAVSNGFRQALIDRGEFIVEINPDGTGLAAARGFFRYVNQGQSGDVGALEEETITLSLSVPDDDQIPSPFAWLIDSSSTVSPAIQAAIEGWQSNNRIYAQYLPDGSTGVKGEVVVSDLSLAGGLEAINEFTVNLQGSGQLTAIP